MFSLWYGVFFLIHDTLNWCHANQWNIGCQLLFSIISTIFSISDCSSNLLCFSRCSLEVNKGNNFHSFGPTMCSSLCLHVWDGIEANLLQAILLLTAAHWSYHSFGLNGTYILTPFPCVIIFYYDTYIEPVSYSLLCFVHILNSLL